MNNSDKINFIFQTGRHIHLHIENQVFKQDDHEKCLLSELSAMQMKVAMQVHQLEPVSLSTLADSIGLSHPSASVIVEKLVEKEIVSRETDPRDRRRIQLRIHPHATLPMDALQLRFHEIFSKLARKVGNENLERWYTVALKLSELIADEKL
ncbi:MarR family transcriptional regulator [Kiritimatiellota bacterium B12222]|nr:MarR family transcriptional regulator [Kiritimatiellota bacterium B12222]